MASGDAAPARTTDPHNRILAGLFFAAWAVVGWLSQLSNAQIIGVDFGADPGPGLMPRIVLCIVSAGSLILLASGLAGLVGGAPGRRLRLRDIADTSVRPMALVLSLLAYVPLVRWLGFIPANVGFAALWMVVLSPSGADTRSVRGLAPIAIGTLVGVGLIYLLFIRWLGVPLR